MNTPSTRELPHERSNPDKATKNGLFRALCSRLDCLPLGQKTMADIKQRVAIGVLRVEMVEVEEAKNKTHTPSLRSNSTCVCTEK